ncbi:(2Fe-2S)-binding protein [Hwanghaeella grinnelliae]|uniref:(2Fe-2S)-binding protein n=1 Tax=Hwanghaeella grinnelliae TaxID=2500179 RepID=A0A3S2W4H4_9PROT|nr:Rieske 2Fe-2S domain-containing protein [Hwanghaeella grinnelliae]RVU36275.1 (2Fe-2S)-binding protein [Hwanghaeella grinnelliae]
MSVRYIPVQWNRNKWFYDGVLLAAAILYIALFLYVAPPLADHARPVDAPIWRARAFGTCAYLMLTVILLIGPLARLDSRFLPLLYNRRHFGVLTFFIAIGHALFVLDWYFAFSRTPMLEALLSSNTAFGHVVGFPFEALGILALLVMAVMAFTSHDFWLSFLGPKLWKRLHLLVYAGYLAATGHLAFGAWLDQATVGLTLLLFGGAGAVAVLHVLAAVKERRMTSTASPDDDWVPVCPPMEIPDKRGRIVVLSPDERVAVFRNGDTLAAVANACAHQNGPLGEGKIVGGCITCPWHGFGYRMEDGRSPPPFTEMIPTYRLRLTDGMLFIHGKANPPGTYQEPVRLMEGGMT